MILSLTFFVIALAVVAVNLWMRLSDLENQFKTFRGLINASINDINADIYQLERGPKR